MWFFFLRFYFKKEGKGGERERNIHRLPLSRPQYGTWPATKQCALTRNQPRSFCSQEVAQSTVWRQAWLKWPVSSSRVLNRYRLLTFKHILRATEEILKSLKNLILLSVCYLSPYYARLYELSFLPRKIIYYRCFAIGKTDFDKLSNFLTRHLLSRKPRN